METEKLSDHPTPKGSHKCVDKQHTIRFALELRESNDKYFPEFSFRELLRSAVPKVDEATENDVPAEEDVDREKLQALAKKFEGKYGPKQKHKKKRKERIEDLVDVTYGYDETDPFVDNSEAYDELIPADWTTEHGGFYINQGGLNFKPVTSDDSDDDDFKGSKKRKTPKKIKDPNKVKKIKDSGEKGKKRKHLTPMDKKPHKIRLISGDKEKKIKKRINLSGSSSVVSSSGPLLIKVLSTNTTVNLSTIPKTTTTTSATVSPTSSSISLASSLMSLGTNNITPGPSMEGSPQSSEKTTVKTEDQVPSLKNTTQEATVLSSDVASSIGGTSNSALLISQNGLPSGEGVGEDGSLVPKLPQYLPLSVEACVQKLKQAANDAVDEGKCKFFNKDVNQLLLETETKSRELSCRVRSGIYDYLAYYLPCTKETLLKRAKKLLLTDQAGRLREPMAKLKAAVDKVMPEQIKLFEEEVKLHVEEQSKQNEAKVGAVDKSPEDKKKELFKSAMEVDDDGDKVEEAVTPTDTTTQTVTEEKTKKASLPRRKFVWTDELRELLSDVVTLRVKLFEMSKTRTTSAEEYLKEFFESEVKTLWPKGWMTSRILFKESKSVHTRVTSTLLKPKKVPGPKKQGESLSPSDALDTSSQNAESITKEDGKAAPVSMDTTHSMNTLIVSPAVSAAAKLTPPVIPMTAAVKIEQIMVTTAAAVATSTSNTYIKTIPKLNPSALSVLKAKLIFNNPGGSSKTTFLTQPGNKVVSATILNPKAIATVTSAPSTSAPVSIATSAAKALAAMVTTGKSSVPMIITTKLPSSFVNSTTQASGVPMVIKTPLSIGSITTKQPVSMVTTTPSTLVSIVTTAKPLTLNRTAVESRGAVTIGESTMEGRPEPRAGTMATNGLERQQQAKFPVSLTSKLKKTLVASVPVQRMQQPASTAVVKTQYHQSVTAASIGRNTTTTSNTTNPTMKNPQVTILDFADMVSADSQDDAQEILSNQLQAQQFMNKSPSPQKPKETSMPTVQKAPQTVVSPPRQQNTAYSVSSPSSSMIRSPTQMVQTRNNMPQSNAALANMLMSCNMGSPNMANLQNKYIDLNTATMMAQRQQAANNKALMDSISTPSRMPMDMHTASVPLTHPVISHQLSNPTQSASVYLPTNLQPTLSMLGHANLQGKTTNPLSHINVVPQSLSSSMMHMNRPLQQQSNMVMTPNPFNQVLVGYNVPSTQSMQMSQQQLMTNPNVFQDPNHNPNGGHPPSSFMPRFS